MLLVIIITNSWEFYKLFYFTNNDVNYRYYPHFADEESKA
jgi:hypothetical protein